LLMSNKNLIRRNPASKIREFSDRLLGRLDMRLAVVLILAYQTAAIYYVWRDFNERNIVRMKPYVMSYRKTGGWAALLPFGIGWIIGAGANAYFRGRLVAQEIAPFAVFFVAAALFWIISN
jgi:hypothetical protein